jgi:hypothetical protein
MSKHGHGEIYEAMTISVNKIAVAALCIDHEDQSLPPHLICRTRSHTDFAAHYALPQRLIPGQCRSGNKGPMQ